MWIMVWLYESVNTHKDVLEDVEKRIDEVGQEQEETVSITSQGVR